MTARALWEALRYQTLTPSVTTMGPCSRGCGNGARGSGVCRGCLCAELDALLGDGRATEWVTATREALRMGWAIDEAVERLP
jgi:hypothetical protein